MTAEAKQMPWMDIAEFVRAQHNGVMGVFLYFGHDGDFACEFKDGDGKRLAQANSGHNMQEAVERCYYEWYIVHKGFRSLMEEAMERP